MILVRQVFRVKWGHMDKVLAAIKSASPETASQSGISRVLTDISGDNFTLVLETKAESLDAFWTAMQAMFQSAETSDTTSSLMEYMEAGHREFYTIEYEA